MLNQCRVGCTQNLSDSQEMKGQYGWRRVQKGHGGSCQPWEERDGNPEKQCVRKMLGKVKKLRCFPKVTGCHAAGLWGVGRESEDTFGDLGQRMVALHQEGAWGGGRNGKN